MNEASALFEQERAALAAGDTDRALAILDDIHRRWHGSAGIHVRVHWAWAGIAFRRRRIGRGLWELVAMTFAAPVSLVQKHFGLVRKNL